MNPIDELNMKLGIGPKRPALPPELVKKGYKSIRQVGKGAFGSANLVFNEQSKQYSVVKEVALAGMSEKARDESMKEVDILSGLIHPNIVEYQECLEMKNVLFIIMEFCDGGDLGTKIRTKKTTATTFREPEAARIFSQIALAMKYLHDRRILHRDLKPQNIFLTKAGVVKLGDFGIATILQNSLTMAKTICGTPYYFSPELCKGNAYNNKSDIWALGCILHEILSLEVPFQGPIFSDLMKRIVESPTPQIPRIDGEWNRLISTMLKKDYKERPAINDVLQDGFLRSQFAQLEAAFNKQADELRTEQKSPMAGRRKSSAPSRPPLYVDTEKGNSPKAGPMFGRRSPRSSLQQQDDLRQAVEGLDMVINGVGKKKEQPVPSTADEVLPEQPVDVVRLQKEFKAVADLCKKTLTVEPKKEETPEQKNWGDSWTADVDLTSEEHAALFNADFSKADPSELGKPPPLEATSPDVQLAAAQALIQTLRSDLDAEKTRNTTLQTTADEQRERILELTQQTLMLKRSLKTAQEEVKSLKA